MLTAMREMLRSKFAGLLFGLIIISMAVWGVTDIFSGGLGGNIIKAGDRAVTAQQLDNRLENYLRNYQQETGEVMTRDQALERGVVDQLFASEASRTANLGYAQVIGAQASIKAAADAVREFEAFRDPLTGEFSIEQYRALLRNQRLTNLEFETDIRDDLTFETLLGATTAAFEAPEVLGKLQANYLTESRTVSWFVMSRDALGEPTPPTDDEVRAFFDENIQAFSQPERRGIDVVSISRDDFVHQAELPDDMLRTFYEANLERRFSGPQTRAYTEVIFPDETSAQSAIGALAGGADPSTLSNVSGVNDRSGLQDSVSDEGLAEELFNQFSLPGSVFGPVQRNNVWVVARLEGITPGEPFPFDDVVDDIRTELANQQAERLYFDAIVKIDDLIGLGMDLEGMAADLGTPLISYAAVDERGMTANGAVVTGDLRQRGLLQQAFDLAAGDQLDAIESDDQVVLARVRDITPASTPEFEEVAEEARAALVARNSSDELERAATAARLRLETGETAMADEAAAVSAELSAPDAGLTRQSFEVGLPRGAITAVFDANAGDYIVSPGDTPDERVIVQVRTVERANDETLAMLTPVLTTRLQEELLDDAAQALESDVREEIELEMDRGGLEAYKRTLTRQQ